MNKKLPIVMMVLALVLSTLACAALGDGEPALSNSRTAFDEDGINTSAVFGAFDTIYVVSDLSNGAAGNVISSTWYVEDADGVDPNFVIDTVAYTVAEGENVDTIYFYFEPPDGGWPAGIYRVEVFFNGNPSATLRFTVQ